MNINRELGSGNTVKKVFKHGSVYLFVSVLSKGMGLLLLPVYTRYLSPEEYGILSTVLSFGGILGIMMSLRIDGAFSRYFFEYNADLGELRKLFSTCFWFTLGLGTVVYAFSLVYSYFYLSKKLGIEFFPIIVAGFLTPLFTQMALLGTLYYKQTHRSSIVGKAQVLFLIVNHCVAVFLLVTTDLTVSARILPSLLAAMLMSAYYINLNIKNKLLGFEFDQKTLFHILPFTLALLPAIASSWINNLSDRIILSVYGEFSATGIYSVGYEIGRSIAYISIPIIAAYTPIMFAKLTENYEEGLKSLSNPILGMFWLMTIIFVSLAIFSNQILYVFASEKFQTANSILMILLFSSYIGSQYVIFANLLGFHKKIMILSAVGIVSSTVNLVLNLIFIPKYGMYAAALSTLASTMVYSGLIIYFGFKYSKPSIDWSGIAKTIIVASSVLLFNEYISTNIADATQLAFRIMLIPALFIMTYIFKIFDNPVQMLRNSIAK